MDALDALRLQLEWGADEALAEAPVNRLRPPPASRPARPPEPASPAAQHPLVPAVARAVACAAGADTLEALRAALAAFDGCPLRDTASNLVFPEGNAASGLMLVGDTPGEHEDRTGRPFAGPAGAYLDRMLGSIGVERAHVLAGLVVPWRPPGGRPASEAEIQCCLPFLHRFLAITQPRRLLLLGPVATRALQPGASRRALRGEWLAVAVPGLPAPIAGLPTAAPATPLAKPGERRRAWADLRVLRRALNEDLTLS